MSFKYDIPGSFVLTLETKDFLRYNFPRSHFFCVYLYVFSEKNNVHTFEHTFII